MMHISVRTKRRSSWHGKRLERDAGVLFCTEKAMITFKTICGDRLDVGGTHSYQLSYYTVVDRFHVFLAQRKI